MYKENKGFTLVEIAIVLTIIGLLIGGIIKGSQMIKNAEVSATIANMKSIQAAMATFRSSYRAYPGDFSTATTQLANCDASTNCTDGNGDSFIWVPYSAYYYMRGTPLDTGLERETWLFWKHLALANLISGVDVSDNGTSKGVPIADIGGIIKAGTHSGNTNCSYGTDYARGWWLSVVPAFNYFCTSGNGFEVKISAQVDRKIDDGMPTTGDLRAGGSVADLCAIDSGGRMIYNMVDGDAGCTFSYKIK